MTQMQTTSLVPALTREELEALALLLRDSGGFAVDLETTSLEPLRAFKV